MQIILKQYMQNVRRFLAPHHHPFTTQWIALQFGLRTWPTFSSESTALDWHEYEAFATLKYYSLQY